MFLSTEELIQLTGRRQGAAQIKILRFMGIEHKIRPDGSVAVLEEHVKSEMGMSDELPRQKNEWIPSWKRHA
jgi:hypothetical protein